VLKTFKIALAAAFAFAALPFAAPLFGGDGMAEARPYYKKHRAKRHHAKRGKYQYQYVPTASGRPGAWR
jgi:hypothetical protein